MESLSDGWISGVSHYYVLMGECDNFYRAAKMMKKFEVQKTLSGSSRNEATLTPSSLQIAINM